MKNRKGFTLIELLAVIIILAIIALIAVPVILNMINQARKSAARSSALGYVEAIEYNNGFAELEQAGYTKITGDDIDISDINIKLKGKKPSSGIVTINSSGKVENATLCINNYTVVYENKDVTSITSGCNISSNESSSNNPENIPAPVSFSSDSWETIAANTTSSVYQPGDIREIKLDLDENGTDETYHLRIANTSTPDECGTDLFSQTSCGFIVEFVEVIGAQTMNNEYSNAGGWPASDLYNYLNVGENSLFNKLPSDLKNVISNTMTVSGYRSSAIEPITISLDKLFFFTLNEVGINTKYDSSVSLSMIQLTNSK